MLPEIIDLNLSGSLKTKIVCLKTDDFLLLCCVDYYLSKPNSLCNTRVANSIYFSSISTDTLISDVEII